MLLVLDRYLKNCGRAHQVSKSTPLVQVSKSTPFVLHAAPFAFYKSGPVN